MGAFATLAWCLNAPKTTETSLRNGVCFLLIVGALHEAPENDGFIAPGRRTEKIQISFARWTPHPPSPTVPLLPQEKANEIPRRDGVLCMLNRRGRRLDAPKTNEFPHRDGVCSFTSAPACHPERRKTSGGCFS